VLKFQWPSHSKDLRFGDVPIPESYIIADYIPAVPNIVCVASATTDIDLIDVDGCGIVANSQQGEKLGARVSAQSQHGYSHDLSVFAVQQSAENLNARTEINQTEAEKFSAKISEKSTQAEKLESLVDLRSSEAVRNRQHLTLVHSQAERIITNTKAQHTETNKIRPSLLQNHAHGLKLFNGLLIDHHHGRLVDVRLLMPNESAIQPPWGYSPVPDYVPVNPEPPFRRSTDLLFCRPKGKHLFFGRPTQRSELANRGAYIVSNTFELKRASDNTLIECSNFSASIDVDSWCWSWSASIPASLQSIIEPVDGDPIEVIATVNGHALRLIVERMSRERRYPDAWLSIGGRGRSAWLAEPYDSARSYDNAAEIRTANQLAEEALEENGVPIGWAVDWQIDDWDVPAGAWRFAGTHIDAVAKIAESAGAYVQSDDTEKTLHILPKYPAMPRDWDDLTADYDLPDDICETESVEWVDKAAYNAVWVVGGADGRKDKIVLTGSAGDTPAQTVVDDLMTDSDVTRQRGLSILADTGRQAMVTIRLPMLPEVGLVHVGSVVDYTERGVTRRGINRATSLQYDYPQVWQTLRIETHG
jgi:hypothetical protein